MKSTITCVLAAAVTFANADKHVAASTKSSNYSFTYSWATNAKMLRPRSDMSATPLNTGRILIAGGCDGKQIKTDWGYGCNRITNTASLFNTFSNTFEATATMPRARYRHTSVHVDGKAYMLGGTNLDYPEPVLAEIDVFDSKTSTWSTLPATSNLPFATTDPASFVIDKKIYYTGGYETTNYTAFANTWVLDTRALSKGWKAVADAPSPRGDAVGVTINDQGYVFGGFTHYNGFSRPVGTLESYDPTTNAWTSLKSMPTARGDKAGAALHGRFHVIGGETKDVTGHSVPISDVEVYDPIEKTWQDEGVIPSKRFRFSAAAVENVIYIFGGQKFLVGKANDKDSYYPVADTVEAFTEQRVGITKVDAGAAASLQTVHNMAVFCFVLFVTALL